MFGPRIGARNERKVLVLIGVQRERLASKVQPGEARFGPELDWEKPWRGQVFGTRDGSFWIRIRLGKAVAGSGVRSQNLHKKCKKSSFFSRDSKGAFGTESATRGGSFWTRIRLGKAVAGSGVRGQDERDKWKQTGCARKMEENCRRHVFGAKIGARNERIIFF